MVSATITGRFDRTWHSQYRRMKAAYRNLPGIKPSTPIFHAHIVEDDFMIFMQAAYALKDWLKNDSDVSEETQDSVEDHINQSTHLCILADLANKSKHLTLDRRPRSNDRLTNMGKLSASGDPTEGLDVVVHIKSNGSTYSGTDFAASVIEEWDKFLLKHKLAPKWD